MPDQEKVNEAVRMLGRALKLVTGEERDALVELRQQIDEAAKVDQTLDKQLEFCYGVTFSPDKFKNERLINACKSYITAIGE